MLRFPEAQQSAMSHSSSLIPKQQQQTEKTSDYESEDQLSYFAYEGSESQSELNNMQEEQLGEKLLLNCKLI